MGEVLCALVVWVAQAHAKRPDGPPQLGARPGADPAGDSLGLLEMGSCSGGVGACQRDAGPTAVQHAELFRVPLAQQLMCPGHVLVRGLLCFLGGVVRSGAERADRWWKRVRPGKAGPGGG